MNNDSEMTVSRIAEYALAGKVLPGWRQIGEGFGLASQIYFATADMGRDEVGVVVKVWNLSESKRNLEVRFYRELARQIGVRVPHAHHADESSDAGRGVLILEYLEGAEQGDCLRGVNRKQAESLIVALADMHSRWWNSVRLDQLTFLTPLRDISDEWLAERSSKFLKTYTDQVGEIVRSLLKNAKGVHCKSREMLAECPEAILHGDLHLDNLMFFGENGEPVFLDWANVRRGPFAIDLAHVLFGMADPAMADDLIDRYLELMSARDAEFERGDLVRWLGGAQLLNFLYATCGIINWQPATEREEALIADSIRRYSLALEAWTIRNPDLLVL